MLTFIYMPSLPDRSYFFIQRWYFVSSIVAQRHLLSGWIDVDLTLAYILLAQHHLLSGWIDVDLTYSAEQARVMSTSLHLTMRQANVGPT